MLIEGFLYTGTDRPWPRTAYLALTRGHGNPPCCWLVELCHLGSEVLGLRCRDKLATLPGDKMNQESRVWQRLWSCESTAILPSQWGLQCVGWKHRRFENDPFLVLCRLQGHHQHLLLCAVTNRLGECPSLKLLLRLWPWVSSRRGSLGMVLFYSVVILMSFSILNRNAQSW